MKHYICVDEHEITYVCGTYRTQGRSGDRGSIVIQDARSIPGSGSLQDLFAAMEETHNLEGKRITLVLGRDLSFMKMKLPKSGDSALRRMARNELAAEGKCGPGCLGAVDIQRASGEKQIPVMVYYIEKERLDPYISAMEQAGILYGGTLLMPDCAAAAARMLCKNRYMIVVDVEKQGLGLYAVSGGHCLAWKSSPLKAAWFCERNAQELLYEEIAEQAAQIQTQVEGDFASAMPECLVLVGNCLTDAAGAAAFLNKRLKLSCIQGAFDVSVEPDPKVVRCGTELSMDSEEVSPGALAAIMAGSRRDGRNLKLKNLQGGEGVGVCKGLCGIMSRGGAMFLLANIVAAVGIGGYMQIAGYQTYQELLGLRDSMNVPEYKKRYQSIQRLDSKMAEDAKRRSEQEKSREAVSAILRKEDFEAFTDAMEPGMEVKAVIYEKGEAPYLEMILSHENSRQVPLYVKRVKESGVFVDVRHSLWEKRADRSDRDSGENRDRSEVWATVRGVLEKGGQNEIQ